MMTSTASKTNTKGSRPWRIEREVRAGTWRAIVTLGSREAVVTGLILFRPRPYRSQPVRGRNRITGEIVTLADATSFLESKAPGASRG